MTPAKPYPNVLSLLSVHESLDQEMIGVRRILPERNPQALGAALGPLRERVLQHAHQEETVLLPAYAALEVELPENAGPQVYIADHDRIRHLLLELDRPTNLNDPDELLHTAELLCRLAGVLEHHDIRERRWFMPTLEAHIEASTKHAWLKAFAIEDARLDPPVTPPLAPLPTPLRPEGPPAWRLLLALAQCDLSGAHTALSSFANTGAHPKLGRHLAWLTAALSPLTEDNAATRDRCAELYDRARLVSFIT